MILFEKDYAHLDKSHFDLATNNSSFIKMYGVLKRMGIRNNRFFLFLVQPELSGIDPHNLPDDVSDEIRMKIAYESRVNPWYILREIIRVPVTGGKIPFQLNRANLAMVWLFFNNIDNFLIMPRQLGKTTCALVITAMIMWILGKETMVALLCKDNALRKDNIDDVKELRDSFPAWMLHKQIEDSNNSEELSYTALGNKYISFVAQGSVAGADRQGRGMTVPIQHWDEPTYYNNIDITYPVAIGTTTAAIDYAKINNQMYGNMLTATAGKLDTAEGKFCHNLICGALVFTESLYDCSDADNLKKLVKSNSKAGMVYSEFSYKQLGKTDEWLAEVAARTSGDDDLVGRDYLNKWSRGKANSILDLKLIDAIDSGKREPEFVETLEDFVINWYLPKRIVKSPDFDKIPIILGTDASENVGGDFTSLIFVNARNLEVIGSCMCNTVNIIKVALLIANFLVKPNILWMVERNNMGVALLDMVFLELEKLDINPFTRIFNNIFQDASRFKNVNYLSPGIYDKYRKEFGFRTTGKSRPMLYKTIFFEVLKRVADKLKDRTLINQICGLTIRNGRVDHATGEHDDMVIAFLLCAYSLLRGENLSKYSFCNNKPELLLDSVNMSDVSDDKQQLMLDNKQIATNIQILKKRINLEQVDTIRLGMIHELNRLQKSLGDVSEIVLEDVKSINELVSRDQTLNLDQGESLKHQMMRYFM